MNRQQFLEARKIMRDNAPLVSSATELAELTAMMMGLEDELDEETSPIWQLAFELFTHK